MTNRHGLTILLVVFAVVVATIPAGALPAMSAGTAAAQDGGSSDTPASDRSNASLGASVSGFMQSSAADTEGEVENEMFAAKFDNASEQRRAALVQSRANNLDKRLERLRQQRAELLNETDGEPTVAQRAKAARLTARIDALQEAINTTSVAADRAGVNLERLDQMRQTASQLNGSEVSELARGLAGSGNGGGPPADRGAGEENRNDRGERGQSGDEGVEGNGSTGVDGNETADAPSNSGNGSSGSNDDSNGQGNDNPGDGNPNAPDEDDSETVATETDT